MYAVRVVVFLCLVQWMVEPTWGQTLDLRRVPGGGAQATDRRLWLWSLLGGPAVVNTAAGIFTGDTSATATNVDMLSWGGHGAHESNDSSATVNTATNDLTSAASVNVANMVTTSVQSLDENEFMVAGVANLPLDQRGGVVGTASGVFEIEGTPSGPALVTSTLTLIGTVTASGQANTYVNEGTARCGRYQVQFSDANGASILTVVDGTNVVAVYFGGTGGNYILRGEETLAVGSQFMLTATGDTQGRSQVVGVGASSSIVSISTAASATATQIDIPVPPSLEIETGGVKSPIDLDP